MLINRSDCDFDVVGVGNAIVDVIASVPESFIGDHQLTKGSMTLIDEVRAETLLAAMPPAEEASGGCAASTTVGVASFGGRSAFVGKVRDDRLGAVFAQDLRAAGVSFEVAASMAGPATARSLIQVTPDAERTMNTYLGIAGLLEPADVDTGLMERAAVTYCEGYLWDVDVAKAAIRTAMDAAFGAGRVVALALSDSFCVERHRAEWLELIEDRVDVVFANEAEICALHCTDDLQVALGLTREMAPTVSVTRGPKGSLVAASGGVEVIAAAELAPKVDSTGAGDQYAAGFLWGLSQGATPRRCAELGSLAAAEVITHVGARPLVALAGLASAEMG